MAHLNLHVAEGLAIGTAVFALPLARAWLGGRPVSGPIGRLAAAAVVCAAWASAPSLLVRLGAPASLRESRWANVFFGHTAIDHRFPGGLLTGEVAIAAWSVAIYALFLLALARARAQTARTRALNASGGNAS